MNQDELSQRLLLMFIQELEEQLAALDPAVVALEQRPADAALIQTVFRIAHTIKGAARAAGVPLIEEAFHELESLFERVRSDQLSLSAGHFASLFALVDAFKDAAARLRAGSTDLKSSPLAGLMPHLRRDVWNAPASARPAQTVPAPALVHPNAPEPDPLPAAVTAPAPSVVAPPVDAPRSEGLSNPVPATAEAYVRVPVTALEGLAAAATEVLLTAGGDIRRTTQAVGTLAAQIRSLRQARFGDVTAGLERTARDVAAETGKQIQLVVTGEEIEADRVVMEALREPLVHLVRNAVDHGIEAPAAREAQGKPARGTIGVSAQLRGGRLLVTVREDGMGLDVAALRNRLAERSEPGVADERELVQSIFRSGVSTRRTATRVSGRGVGLDLVRTAVQKVGGTVHVDWEAGKGTRFELELPPAPSLFRAILFTVGAQAFAVPVAAVERVARLVPSRTMLVEGRTHISFEGEPVPVLSMAAVLGPPFVSKPLTEQTSILFLRTAQQPLAFAVDSLITEQEIVVRPLGRNPIRAPQIAGGTFLSSGAIALVLNPASLADAARSGQSRLAAAAPARRNQRILVVDDSITTRTLEQGLLEAAGFDVVTAVDGQDALDRLAQDTFDLVVSDIDMPRLNGIGLCQAMRSSPSWKAVPVVLVTAQSRDEDRARGLEAGADAYLVKSGFDQATLLETIRQLIG